MQNERELLEYAAKAAGIEVWFDDNGQPWIDGDKCVWNPRTDSGQALELAVKLSLLCDHDVQYAPVNVWEGEDPLAATRLAITRAAAEIGRAMP